MDLDQLWEVGDRFGQGRWRDPEWGPGDAWGTRVSAHQYRPMFRLLEQYVPAGSRVLDWGSGSGRFSFCLLEAGYEVAAGDLVRPPLLAEMQARFGDRYEFRDLEVRDLPFADAEFDAVTSMGVLEHVRDSGGDERDSLGEIHRVLKPGGMFVCAHFPNQTSWIDWAARRSGAAHAHEFRYRREEIEALMADSGFELLTLSRYAVLPRNRASKLPTAISERPAGVRLFDAADAALSVPLRPLCQNWGFAARRVSSAN